MSIDCEYINNNVAENDENDNDLSENSEDIDAINYDDYNDSNNLDHLNEMLDRISKKPKEKETQFSKPMAKTTTETTTTGTNKPPPTKKRMFNDKDYTKMMNAMMVYDADDVLEDFEDDKNVLGIDDEEEDEDIIELGESFAMNYWHNTVEDMRVEEDEEINEHLDRRASNYVELVSRKKKNV